MNTIKVLREIDRKVKENPSPEVYYDYVAMIRKGLQEDPDNKNRIVEFGKKLANIFEKIIPKTSDVERMKNFYYLHEQLLLALAPYDFDSYCLYIEWDRDPRSKFYAPRRKQLRPLAEALQDLYEGKYEVLCLSLPPGIGKLLADDTPIMTREGWKNHGDLVVGDEVLGMDGKFKKVTHVHPKYMCDVEVEFTNGEIIQCHENHVWRFYDRAKGKEIQCSIKDIEKRTLEIGTPNKRGHRYIFQVPKHGYMEGTPRDLPVDPYALGVWLGDGTNKSPRITTPECDRAIIERIISKGYRLTAANTHKTTGVTTYGFGNLLGKSLRKLDMCHWDKKGDKYIPEMYLTASIEQRLELLAGLIDTDGTMKYDGRYIYSTTSEKLRDGVCDLISTFGWRYSVTKYEPKLSSSGIQGRKPCYTISFNADCLIPCAVERKRNTRCIEQRKIAVKAIRRVEPKQGNCITVEGDGMYLAGRTMIPTHNSALALFFLTWWGAHIQNRGILTVSHNHVFVKAAYEEIKKIVGKDSEYRFHDVFPNATIKATDAMGLTIAFDSTARFPTFQFGSLGSGLAGRVRAESLLFCDDLIPGIEVALSEDQLQKTWNSYTSDLLQRKIGGCRELHIATRWSVRDVIGRIKMQYEENPSYKFIEVSAYDEKGKSAFDYPYGLGYTTAALNRLRKDMDEATFNALYMNEPIEREGQLYASEELRRFFELPDRDPDAIVAICDTKEKGEDYCVLPVAYIYGQDVYIEDCVCNDGKPEAVETMLVNILIKHKVQLAQFESNAAGGKIAESVQARVKEQGGVTKIITKRTLANKETKIYANAPYVKEHFLFKDKSVIDNNREYRRMMQFLTSYTMKGKNKHDDVPDGMAMLALYIQSFLFKSIEVLPRPF